MGTPSASHPAQFGDAVAAQVEDQLSSASLTGSYRDDVGAALRLDGNILSTMPDLRWARPVLVCCEAAGGRGERSVPVAAAVEMFMVALDMLDDFEDREDCELERRIGAPRALNVTTGLQLLAQRCLLGAADGGMAAQILLEAGLRACSGQHADLGQVCDGTGLDGAWSIAAEKSGSLAAAICQLGALAAGADGPAQTRYASFGRLLGIAAQLANDLRALAPGARGKTDLLFRRPTLPLVFASCAGTDGVGAQPNPWSSGAAHFTWAVADTHRRRAMDLIPALTADDRCRVALASLLHVL